MKTGEILKIGIGILLFVVVLYSLATSISITSKEGFLVGTTGISQTCTPGVTLTPGSKCYDISYVDSTTGLNKQVSAQILPGYYIDTSGYLEIVPYGYQPSLDLRSYSPLTQTAKYVKGISTNEKSIIDASINLIQAQINATPTPDTFTLWELNQQLDNLKQKQLSIIDTNDTSNKQFNPDNLDITYHADPTKEKQDDESTAGVGKMWIEVSGNLVAIPYSDVSNTTLYNQPGTYQFNSASYVPNYEESVFLSKLTNEPTTSKIHNLAVNQPGFCEATKGSMIDRDAKCNALGKDVCASTDCCVLLGGEKCVAGSQGGPTVKSNYSDQTIINRDYYYYRGQCFGNCS
jgi:hypothetical protein